MLTNSNRVNLLKLGILLMPISLDCACWPIHNLSVQKRLLDRTLAQSAPTLFGQIVGVIC